MTEMQRVLDGHATVDEFQRSCQLKGPYAAPQPQSVVQEKIRERKPGSEPRTGDRVTYVMQRLPGRPDAKTFEMAEDPGFMVAFNLPVATYYYIKSFRTCLEQLFEVEGKGMKRIRLIFDQAEDIAHAQTMGDATLPNGGQINDYKSHEDLVHAPESRDGRREDNKAKTAKKQDSQRRSKAFFENWAQSGAVTIPMGLSTPTSSSLMCEQVAKKCKVETKNVDVRKQFFKDLNKRKKNDAAMKDEKRLVEIARREECFAEAESDDRSTVSRKTPISASARHTHTHTRTHTHVRYLHMR
jgi:hypothetical protein